jgi:nitroreductase
MTPTIELLRSHRSIRHFTDAPISDEQRAAIIASAQGASSSSFLQCSSIIRVTDPEIRQQLVPLSGGQQHVAQAAEFWVFCADFNRNLQICPDAQLGLAEQLLLASIPRFWRRMRWWRRNPSASAASILAACATISMR